MEFLIGIAGRDYVLLGSDRLSSRSILIMSRDCDKLHPLSTHQLLGVMGDKGETDRLRERIVAESSLASYRMDRCWTTSETAWFARSLMAHSLRTRNPYQAQILMAGLDPGSATPDLYWMDNLASLHKLPYAVHGHGASFSWGILDKGYRPDMSLDEALALVKQVLRELQTRFIIQTPNLALQVVDPHGIRPIELN